MVITSVDNDKIKSIAKLNNKKYRNMEGKFLIETENLCYEAYRNGVLEELFVLDGEVCLIDVYKTYCSKEVMAKLSSTDSVPRVVGVAKKVNNTSKMERVLLLDSIQDPGNLGTIIRSSVAFNIDTIVLGSGCVDLYNSKVLRSSEGMIFNTCIIESDLVSIINKLKERDIPVYSTNVNNGIDVRSLSDRDKERFGLVIGNEGNGVSRDIDDLCDGKLYIEMNGKCESLNVAVATSILLYELGR